MRPKPNGSFKQLEKLAIVLLFPIFSAKAVFALKVWENLKKNQNTQAGFEPSPLLVNVLPLRALAD